MAAAGDGVARGYCIPLVTGIAAASVLDVPAMRGQNEAA